MNTKILIQEKEYVTINTASRLINMKKPMIYYYLKQGKLKTFHMEGILLISLDSLNELNVYRHFRQKSIIEK